MWFLQDLIERILRLERDVSAAKEKVVDMGSYVDALLVKIMEAKPEILQIEQAGGCKRNIQKA